MARRAACTWMIVILAVSATSCRNEHQVEPEVHRAEPNHGEGTANPQPAAPSKDPAGVDLNKVGRVNFSTNCDPASQTTFERAIALLHSFFYTEARKEFTKVTQQDSSCAIAFWGIAMTWYHPIWTPPNPEEFESGRAAIDQAVKASKKTDRDKLMIDALVAFYQAPRGPAVPGSLSCHGSGISFPAQAAAWSTGMEAAFTKLPDDEEVAAFYALSLLGAALPSDLELKNQKKAADILEKLWSVRKDHPGVTHYLIHAYDYPPFATRGLAAAKAYSAIAPAVPHALHMPSHIFVRLGMWNEAIESNLKSATAARGYTARDFPGAVGFDELHALDYLEYAYLQLGKDDLAGEIAQRIPMVKKTAPETDAVAAYAMGAIPARFAVERHAWKEAAALLLPDLPFWKKFPHAEAHIEYARGLGRARLGDVAGAQESLDRLAQLRDATTDPKFGYFQKHIDLQHQAVSAWLANAQGKKDQAVKMMRAAAELEDKLGKHPVSPGAIAPIYEQLGDLLVEDKRPAEALSAYEAALKTSPKRFNALYGAGHAAQLANKDAVARTYYQELIDVTASGGSQRPELAEARAFLAKK